MNNTELNELMLKVLEEHFPEEGVSSDTDLEDRRLSPEEVQVIGASVMTRIFDRRRDRAIGIMSQFPKEATTVGELLTAIYLAAY